ncbi:hypothetical protein BKI52_31815 [marine bacterium AO1-C]|nr:hypothetical protein BKI52_31815 [marine bacterium AO1-C]
MKSLTIILSIMVCWGHAYAQCDLTYGTNDDRRAIQQAMLNGSAQEVIAAINRAKATRGIRLGCPEIDYTPREPANTTRPTLAAIETLWDNVYKPGIERFVIQCPEIARGSPSLALGAYYARLANPQYFDNLTVLGEIGKMLEAQQYSEKYATAPLVATPGIYGYFFGEPTDDCALTGVAGVATTGFCERFPSLCVPYTQGLFAGQRFATTDHTNVNGELIGDIGGAGFDMGWAGAHMIEAAIQQTNPQLKSLFKQSVLLAGEWAMTQPLVTNHNYTAKLIWMLAQLYNWTGREDFKNALTDRVERNLKPGVLMDVNNDSLVDGVTGIPFSSLNEVARVPGRMWDGHNALPWYHSMNAWAALEAYVAYRDRGDIELAIRLKPYVVAMLDNLAHELVNIGLPFSSGPGSRDIPFSLLNGIWKISQYEQEAHPLWEQAVWAIWNQGVLQEAGARGLNLGLYFLILTNTQYQPLAQRDSARVTGLPKSLQTQVVNIYPNPAQHQVKIPLNNPQIKQIEVLDIRGKVLFQKQPVSEEIMEISLKMLKSGVYFIRISLPQQVIVQKLLIK